MLLILEQQPGPLGALLERSAGRRGIRPLRLSASALARELTVAFQLEDRLVDASFIWRHVAFSSSDLRGVYNSIDTFLPSCWPQFSDADARYAARESHALWLALLSALPCPVVNPPALSGLGGTALTPAEFFWKAREAGLAIPAIVHVERGAAAVRLHDAAVNATVYDLGDEVPTETPLQACRLDEDPWRDHQLRIRDYASGVRACICLVGDTVFTTSFDSSPASTSSTSAAVPGSVLDRLRALHRSLHLRLAEYALIRDDVGEWSIAGYQRAPSGPTLAVHGEAVAECVVTLVTGEEVVTC